MKRQSRNGFTRRIPKAGCALSAVCLVLFLQVSAPKAAETPRSFVARIADIAAGVIRDVDAARADEQFIDSFDMPVFAKRCLIDHWEALTKAQRKEFIAVFDCSLRTRLGRLIRERLTERLKERKLNYDIGRPKKLNGGITAVPLATRVNETSIDFVYYVAKGKGGYGLADYEAEGALLSRQYRGNFNYLMRKYGFDGMLRKMRKKNAECANVGL